MKDHCTRFPESWYQWYLYNGFIPAWRKVYIGWMCEAHDNNAKDGEEFQGCANTQFYKDTWRTNLVGSVVIASVAGVACWIRYPKQQRKRI